MATAPTMPASSASTPPSVAAEHHEGRFTGARGLEIYWQAWVPPEPRAVVVISHGASEHSGRYRYVVERLVPERYALYTVDHRGHGRSGGPRAFVDRMRNVVDDLDQLVDIAVEQHPGLPLFLLGHSFGGCVAVEYALAHEDRLSGLALSAPLAALEAAPLPLRAVARTLSILAPRTPVYEVPLGGISRDADERAAYDADPLVFRGKIPARTVTEIADAVGSFPERVPELSLPLLVMHGTADEIVPIAGAEMIHERASSPDKRFERYEGYFHEIFNEPAGERDRPLDEVAGWLNAHLSD